MRDLKLPTDIPEYPLAGPIAADAELFCETCSYSLTGLVGTTRCPECGAEFNPFAMRQANIPWLKRRQIGNVRAYLHTFIVVLFRPSALAAELCKPTQINVGDAQKFRRWSLAVASGGTFVILFAILTLSVMGRRTTTHDLLTMTIGILMMAVGIHVHLFIVSVLPILFRVEDSKESRRLLCAESYATAPMGLVPPVILVSLLFLMSPISIALLIVIFGLVCYVAVLVNARLMLANQVTSASRREVLLGFFLHIAWWCISAFLTFMVCTFLGMAIATLVA